MIKFHTDSKQENPLQGRLMSVFTVLFVFCMLSMSFFLFNLVRSIALVNESRAVFERTRQLYRLDAMVKRHEMAVQQYLVNGSPAAKEESAVLGKRIGETVDQMRLPPEDQADLGKVDTSGQEMLVVAGKIFAVVDAESQKDLRERDWSLVESLGAENDALMLGMYQSLERMSRHGVDQLMAIQLESQWVSQVVFWSGILAIVFFLVLLLVSSLMIYRYINLPTEQLIRAVYDLNAGKLHHPEMALLARRADELGELAAEFLRMADEISQRSAQLKQEADEIRAKIHP